MRRWLLILFLLTSCTRSGKVAPKEAALPPVLATSSVDKAQISTEDPITFSVVINRGASIQPQIPDIGSQIKGFRIIDFGNDEKEEDKRKITRKWFTLRADASGSYILPEVEVKYGENGEEKSVKTSEIFVEVKAPDAASSDKQEDIRDIKDLERSPSHILVWVCGLLGVFALGAGIFLFLKRKKKPSEIIQLAPHEEALRRLEELPLPEDSKALKKFYFSLSEIMRSYVEGRYGLRATDMTSEEIVRCLRTNSALPEGEKPVFIQFLKESDLVKFTDFHPPLDDIKNAKERVKSFVAQTKPMNEETSERESVV